MDLNQERLHELTLNFCENAWFFSCLLLASSIWVSFIEMKDDGTTRAVLLHQILPKWPRHFGMLMAYQSVAPPPSMCGSLWMCHFLIYEMPIAVSPKAIWIFRMVSTWLSPSFWQNLMFRQWFHHFPCNEKRREHYTLPHWNAARQQRTPSTSGKKFTHAHEGSRSAHATALDSNPSGFLKKGWKLFYKFKVKDGLDQQQWLFEQLKITNYQ